MLEESSEVVSEEFKRMISKQIQNLEEPISKIIKEPEIEDQNEGKMKIHSEAKFSLDLSESVSK